MSVDMEAELLSYKIIPFVLFCPLNCLSQPCTPIQNEPSFRDWEQSPFSSKALLNQAPLTFQSNQGRLSLPDPHLHPMYKIA